MLGTTRGGRASEPGAGPKEMCPRNQQKARSLGLTSATGLAIGSARVLPSIMFDQAENRLHTIKALMVATIGAPA